MEPKESKRKFFLSEEAQSLVLRLPSAVNRPWYKPNRIDKETLRIISRLIELDELVAAPAIARFLLLSGEDAGLARCAIESLLADRSTRQLQKLDERCRGNIAPYHAFLEWRALEPAHLGPHTESVHTLGLASFHPNGRVRERAIRHLAHQDSDAALSYLLIRANDWVGEVHEFARNAVLRKVREAAGSNQIISNLALARSLEAKTRQNLVNVATSFRRAALEDADGLFRATSAGLELVARREVYRTAWGLPEFERSRFVERGLADLDCVIASQAARQVCMLCNEVVRSSYLHLMFHSQWATVRLTAVRFVATKNLSNSETLLSQALFDSSASIRACARFHLRRHGRAANPIDVYVKALRTATGARLVSTVSGIGECGDACHAEIVEPFMAANRPRLASAAILATARLDINRAASSLPKALTSQFPRVSLTARQIIIKTGTGAELAAEVFGNLEHYDHVRLNALKILCGRSKWERLVVLMGALTDPIQQIRHYADVRLHYWRNDYNRSFTQPTRQQRQETLTLVNTLVISRHPVAQFVRNVMSTG